MGATHRQFRVVSQSSSRLVGIVAPSSHRSAACRSGQSSTLGYLPLATPSRRPASDATTSVQTYRTTLCDTRTAGIVPSLLHSRIVLGLTPSRFATSRSVRNSTSAIAASQRMKGSIPSLPAHMPELGRIPSAFGSTLRLYALHSVVRFLRYGCFCHSILSLSEFQLRRVERSKATYEFRQLGAIPACTEESFHFRHPTRNCALV